MRVLVTGARGKVARPTVAALVAAGHAVTGSDIAPPRFGPPAAGSTPAATAAYVQADLTDAGEVFALVGGFSDGQGATRGRFDADDLADAIVLAAQSDLPGHEVAYIAAEDTIGGRDLHASWRAAYPEAPTELRPVQRTDASGIDCGKARRLLGWTPSRTWRDHLDAAGRPLRGELRRSSVSGGGYPWR